MRVRRGFTILEAIMATLLVGVTIVAAMTALGGARAGHARLLGRHQGRLLAEDLKAEIDQQPFEDPASGGDWSEIGPGGEEAGAGRSGFDDCDDYDGWSARPPQRKDGSEIPDASDFRRSVEVFWARTDDPLETASFKTGLKRIELSVTWRKQAQVELVWLRSGHMPDPVELRSYGW